MEQNQKAGQSLGIAGLVLGILGAVASFIPCFGLFAMLFGVLAIIFGAIGLSQAKKAGAKTTLPMAGLVLGIISCVITLVWWISIGATVAGNADKIKEVIEKAKVEAEKEANDTIQAIEAETDSIK